MDSAYARPPSTHLLRLTTSPAIDAREHKLDDVLADSFPASDPPPWTFGRATGAPWKDPGAAHADEAIWAAQTTVIVSGEPRTAWQWLASGVGAIGVGLLIPAAILVIGISVALATRIMSAVIGWVAVLGQ